MRFSSQTNRLGTSIVYVPLRRAAVPSPLRQLAYAESTPVIGPDGDPYGWKVLPSVKITGTVFDTRQVEVECTVRLAQQRSQYRHANFML